ncbi:nickel ABC transporter ATP-binding protein NikE [Paenibacillus hodogayensis]|uniref:Nickel ABC transporter ATP-binding protein NikE n=1 Tax=Paenibacillus hodogayensis TaxID=279208 RepID=A0ABV5W2R9_9BACL
MSNPESRTVLRLQNLQVGYEQNRKVIRIVDNLSLELKKGEIVVLLGESGSGKSTIAKAITGLLPPSAHIGGGTLQIGSAWIGDVSDTSIRWEQIRGRGIAMLFQDAQQALNPVLKIKEHFKETLLFHRIASSAEEVMTISAGWLSRLNFTDPHRILNSYPFQLSGGMCQRICLALALCLEPEVFVADEPTSALDTVNQKEVLDVLKSMQTELGLTVLLITHDIAVANAVGNRVVVLHQGRIEEEGEVGRVFSRPQAAYTRQLLSSRSQRTMPAGERELKHSNEPLLEMIELEKTFHPQKRVLHNVNLTLNKMEIVGILGQSGCGKSTLAKCIVGLESPSGGRVMYRGTDISRLKGKPKREVCKQIQIVFQNARASLNPGRTALQLVQEPLHYLQIGSKKEREALAVQCLHEVGITGEAQQRRPPQLSTGQCQRIAIARALALRPEVLVCDEAVSALDMSVQAQILELLQRLHKQLGFSIVMISHDIRVLRSFCHHIAVMNHGSFSEGKQSSALLHLSDHPHTRQLLQCAGDLEEGLQQETEGFSFMLQNKA